MAAFLVEPIQGEGGYVIPPAGWLGELRRIADDHGILLIADEIQTGFGRTGEWFASQTLGLEPDILCLAKGIANGFPLGATAARGEVMGKWGAASHGSTFGKTRSLCGGAGYAGGAAEEHLLENARPRELPA
jgi:4-aminobutyrate aminotransferase